MNNKKLLEFSKVYHERLGISVILCDDILNKIKDELIKKFKICEMCHQMKLKKDIPLRTPKLGYNFVCHHCWEQSFIDWGDDYY